MSLKQRVERLEQEQPRSGGIWMHLGDGIVRGPNGEKLTREEFDRLYPDAVKFTIPLSDAEVGEPQLADRVSPPEDPPHWSEE